MRTGENKNKLKWYVISIFSIIGLTVLFWSSDCPETVYNTNSETRVNSSLAIPDSLTFCNEKVPIEFFDVREALERELLINSYWHSQTILLIKKANRYFHEIEPVLKENNLPEDFKYLPIAESGFANVVSPSGAVGFWQLLEGTAKDYGLEINNEVDERYHLEKATNAASKYILESYKKYNNWTLAAASYNAGRKGVDRQIEKQKETNYYDLLFNEETARYVYRIIALKLVIENPEAYSFDISKNDLYQPIAYKNITVNQTVNSWADFAKEHSTNYKMIKILNPWLRDQRLTNSANKEYQIRVPQKKARNSN